MPDKYEEYPSHQDEGYYLAVICPFCSKVDIKWFKKSEEPKEMSEDSYYKFCNETCKNEYQELYPE